MKPLQLTFLWLILVTPLAIADSEPTQPPLSRLSLQEAIDYALENSPLIKGAKITIALAEVDLKATRWWRQLIPNVNLHQGYDPVFGDSNIGFTLNFDLDRFLMKAPTQGKKAELKLFDAQVYMDTIKRQVIATVTKSYFDYIIAKQKVTLLSEQLSRDVKLREIIQIKFESGQTELGNLFQIDTVTSNHRLDLLRAQVQVKLAALKLKSDTGD